MANGEFKSWLMIFVLCSIILGEILTKATGKKQTKKKCECGLSNDKRFHARIVAGDIVNPPNKYPWMVSLINTTGDNFCGGAIISPYVILSAAHCFVRADYNSDDTSCLSRSGKQSCLAKPSDVQVGLVTKSDLVKPYSTVAKMIPHPKFDLSGPNFDIGLLIMKDPIPCELSSRSVCLPESSKMAGIGHSVTNAGWGTTTPTHDNPSRKLQMAMLKIVDQKDCIKAMGKRPLSEATICLNGDGKQSPCFGDSGSPIFLRKSGKYYCIGVASMHSSPNCEKNMPIVFIDVYSFLPWIRETMKENEVEIQ